MRLRFARLSERHSPTKGSARAAGYDLYRWWARPCRPRAGGRPAQGQEARLLSHGPDFMQKSPSFRVIELSG